MANQIIANFVRKYYEDALYVQKDTGVAASFILAQAGLESAWGRRTPGHMFFGVKDSDGLNGNEQLLRTTEISRRKDLKFPEILSITPFDRNGVTYYRYVVRDYFRKFESPRASFQHHAALMKSKRYAKCVSSDAREMAQCVAKAGYATDPDYADKLVRLIDIVEDVISHI